jgi:hypothetical protein
LLAPDWTRGILVGALSVTSDDGPVDVDRVVELLASGQPLLELPRQPWPTMRRGVQVLVDLGDGMLPFARDARVLQHAIGRVAGEAVHALRFVGCPSRGAGAGPKPWGSYAPPTAGTPVVVLTDLGIARPPDSADPGTVSEWLAFAGLVHRAGCPLVAFVPYPDTRIPPELTRAMAVLNWDRATSAQTIRRRLGRPLTVRA